MTTYEMFVESLNHDLGFPIPIENFKRYYAFEKQIASYKKVCDYLEEIYLNKDYNMNLHYERELSTVRRILHNIYMTLLKNCFIQKIFKVIFCKQMKNFDQEEFKYNLKMSKNNYASRREINFIKQRIKECLERNS